MKQTSNCTTDIWRLLKFVSSAFQKATRTMERSHSRLTPSTALRLPLSSLTEIPCTRTHLPLSPLQAASPPPPPSPTRRRSSAPRPPAPRPPAACASWPTPPPSTRRLPRPSGSLSWSSISARTTRQGWTQRHLHGTRLNSSLSYDILLSTAPLGTVEDADVEREPQLELCQTYPH